MFDQKNHTAGFHTMIRPNRDFLLNNELKIVADVDVLEVVGNLDIPVETTKFVDVNGFQVLASQVKQNTRIEQIFNVSHLSFTLITSFFFFAGGICEQLV